MGLRKGTSIISEQAFLGERFGPEAWSKLLVAVSEEDRRALASVVAGGWYDVALHARLNRALCDVFFDGNLAGAEELGRYTAERDYNIDHRWILRLVGATFAIQHMDIYWNDGEDTGHWNAVMQGDHIVAELSGWANDEPVLCRRLLGYLGRTLERVGTVAGRKHTRCRALGDATCVFEFDCHIDSDAPEGKGVLTKSNILEIGRELCRLPDLESLAQAIVDLVQVIMGYHYFELWLQWPDSNEPVILRNSGSKTGLVPQHFVLQKANRKVGLITIEVPQNQTSHVGQELLDDLLPWITLTLDAALMSSKQATPMASFTRRLLSAQNKWLLTPRQMEVLELVLRGQTNKEIAAALHCEEGNVEQHVTHIKRNAGAEKTNRAVLTWKFWMEL